MGELFDLIHDLTLSPITLGAIGLVGVSVVASNYLVNNIWPVETAVTTQSTSHDTPYVVERTDAGISVRNPDPIVEVQWNDFEPLGSLDNLVYVGGTGRGVISGFVQEGHPDFEQASEYYRTQIFPSISEQITGDRE